jgi:hypothetical protein
MVIVTVSPNRRGVEMSRYLLAVNFEGGVIETPMEEWKPEEVTGSDLFTALNALRQWGDQYLSPKPMRLLRRKADKTPVVAALVAEGAPVLAADEIELVPGPGFPRHAKR